MFAELTYIIYGAPTVNYLKVLERLQKHRWELWRDPAKDVQGRWEPALTACEQVNTLGQPILFDGKLFQLLYLVNC